MKRELKKKKGFVLHHIVIIIMGILMFLFVGVSFMGEAQSLDKYLIANRIAGNYMKKMDSYGNGYLSEDKASKLVSDFQSNGFTNIDLTGTTMSEVDNGGDIYLDIKFDQTIKQFSFDGLKLSFQSKTVRSEIAISDTSKN
ncbi:hypothetical protein [Clostridium akagii]|uniref:hypothetical protein n=1 Tax=Clostridium akagii TaxID=91623 RepID=UPI00047AE8A2|nr:hypothetical protein [Clostridium akagii]